MKTTYIVLIGLLVASAVIQAQEVTSATELVFEGYPDIKIAMYEDATQQDVTGTDKPKWAVLIVKEGENYYWSSRDNLQLEKMDSGGYITYFAVNGAGYIRIVKEEMIDQIQEVAKTAKAQGIRGLPLKYIYMEHLIDHLGSITYYGYPKHE